MKRFLALAAVGAAAFVPVTPAGASHLCVTSGGRPVYCAPHYSLVIDEYCVTRGGTPIVCVP